MTNLWQNELDIAAAAARAAGKIVKHLFGRVGYEIKKSDTDLLTRADLHSEKTIVEIIGTRFPQDNILAEEGGNKEQTSNRTWLVDPVDGTTNFVHGFPFFGVSIGLEVDGEMVVGVVHNPVMNEFFQASKGNGAFLNQSPIHVSGTRKLHRSLLATGFPYDIKEKTESVMALFKKMIVKAQGVRRPGAASIDMCYVASGRFDGFWEQDLNPWDTAAGLIILKEAGGKVTTFDGGNYTPYEKTVIAANPDIHGEMVKMLRPEGLVNSE